MSEMERQELAQFLREVERLLEEEIPTEWLAQELVSAQRGAWEEIKPRFEIALNSLEDWRYDEGLESIGLAGASLEFKLTGFRRALANFRQKPQPRLLKKVLRWTNVLLGSLAGVIPGAEAIKEYKESTEEALEDESPAT